jgi:hypothetical protein
MRLRKDVQFGPNCYEPACLCLRVDLGSACCRRLHDPPAGSCLEIVLTDALAGLVICLRRGTATWRSGIHVQATVAMAPSVCNRPLFEPSAWMIPRCLSPEDSFQRMQPFIAPCGDLDASSLASRNESQRAHGRAASHAFAPSGPAIATLLPERLRATRCTRGCTSGARCSVTTKSLVLLRLSRNLRV